MNLYAIRRRDVWESTEALRVTAARSAEVGESDFDALEAHGFGDEDIWDIGAITALFGLSNRMANLVSMQPNPEFYLLGRVPKPAKG